MKNILSKIFLYYYVSYYKFFKNVKQSDKEASENAKGIFIMNSLLLLLLLFSHCVWANSSFLHEGSNLRFFTIIIFFFLCIYVYEICEN